MNGSEFGQPPLGLNQETTEDMKGERRKTLLLNRMEKTLLAKKGLKKQQILTRKLKMQITKNVLIAEGDEEKEEASVKVAEGTEIEETKDTLDACAAMELSVHY